MGPRECGLKHSDGQLKEFVLKFKRSLRFSGGAVIACKPNKRGCKCVQKKWLLESLAPCFRRT